MKKAAIIFSISLAIITAIMFSCGGGGGGVDSAMEDNSFTISYNANGAESGTAPVAQKGKNGSSLTISDNVGGMAKSGYLFDGWNEHPDGAGSIWRPGTLYCGDLKLYAMWVPLFSYEIIGAGSPAPALDGVQRAPSLSSIRITGLTQWGDHLSSIIIPSTIDGYTVSAIGNYAFSQRELLTSITIPESITTIGDGVFYNCSNLSNIVMKSSTPPVLGIDTFVGCTSVAISVPTGASINYNADLGWNTNNILEAGNFGIIYNGNGATGGTVPDKQVGISGSVIQISGNTGNLTNVDLAFSGWNTKADGTGITYAENATYSGPDSLTLYAQWYRPGYSYVVTFDSNSEYATTASPNSKQVYEPATTIGQLPTPPKRDGYIFNGWNTKSDGTGSEFTAETPVPESIRLYAQWIQIFKLSGRYIIGFTSEGEQLSSIIIPAEIDGVEILGATFENCTNIKSVTIQNNISFSINQNAFKSCTSLTSITIQGQCTIGQKAFNQCGLLTTFIAPECCDIGDSAFVGCFELKNVSIGNNVRTIGSSAFSTCEKLTDLNIGNKVTSIGNSAFSKCAFSTFTIPDSVTSIGENAFSSCHNLTSISIPKHVSTIGDGAFTNCSKLTDITVDNDNSTYSSIDGVLFNKNKTELIQFPRGKRGSYTIPAGVTAVREEAWYYLFLSQINIGSSVTSINSMISSDDLVTIKVENPTPPSVNEDFLRFCPNLTQILVPSSSVNLYKNATGWNKKASKIIGY